MSEITRETIPDTPPPPIPPPDFSALRARKKVDINIPTPLPDGAKVEDSAGITPPKENIPPSAGVSVDTAPGGRRNSRAASTTIYFRDHMLFEALTTMCSRHGGSVSAVINQLARQLVAADRGTRTVTLSCEIHL